MPTIYHPRNGVSGVGYTTTNTIVTVDWTAMHLWQRDGRPIRSFAVPEYMSGWAVGQGAAFAPAGGNAATLFDTVSGKEIGQLRHDGPIRAITRSWPKFDRFATYSFDDQTVRIWDTSGKRRAVLKHPSGILTGTFGTDGSFLTIAEDSHVRIWSSSGRLREEFQVPGEVASCLWSPKGDRLLTSHDEARTLRLWTAKGKEVGTLAERSLPAQAWGFTWQGDEILTASGSTVRLWDKDGRSTKVIEHPDRVGMGMFLCDRDGFVTGCDDGLVRHWDLEGKLLAVMDGHKGIGITCADFTDDGAFLATGADDGTVRIWPLKRDDLSRIARDRVSRDFTPAERERFAALLAK